MNTEQRQQCLDICNRFTIEKLNECAEAHYKGQSWDAPMIVGLTVNEFLKTINRIFSQIKLALEDSEYYFYPFDYTHMQNGSSSIATELNRLVDGIEQRRGFGEFLISVEWLKDYLFHCNLWNKEKENININEVESKQVKIFDLLNKLKGGWQELDGLRIAYLDISKQLITEKDTFTQFLEVKKQELQTISDTVQFVNNQKTEVDTELKNAQASNAKIRAIQENHNELYEQLKSQREGQEKDFKVLVDKLKDEEAELRKALNLNEEKIKYFNSIDEFLNSKKQEIIKLTGLAADGSLGHSFNSRKGELNVPLTFWKWGVPVMTLIVVAWVVAVFTQFFTKLPDTLEWSVVATNIIKTIPMFVLLGFTVNQYTKERNLQEEYAFKAAVAMTITAYSDKLENKNNKEILIMDSVKNIYSPPKIQAEKSGSIFSFRTRSLSDAMKNLTEAVKEFKK